MVTMVVSGMEIKIVSPGAKTKRGPRPHGSAVWTVIGHVRNVVTKTVSVVAEGKRRHAREHRIGTVMSGTPKALAERSVLRKVRGVLEAMVHVDLMVVPNGPDTNVFFDRIRMMEMIGDKEAAREILGKVVTREVEMKKGERFAIVGIWG